MKILLIALLLISTNVTAATCTINVENIASEERVLVVKIKEATESQLWSNRAHFVPPFSKGRYQCTLALRVMGEGTMLSCADSRDVGGTWWQSDRTVLHDANSDNHLRFSHEGTWLQIKTSCK